LAGKYTKSEVVERLKAERDAGRAIYDALCGTGITAKMAARGGADLVTTFNLAHFRMQGLSSMAGYLPIGDANAITAELGERSVVQAVGDTPVIAGVLGSDPTRDMSRFVCTLSDIGFDGIMNCPTVALIDGNFRKDLEETGLGYAHEVETLGHASALDLFTKAFCTTPDEAIAMAEAGVNNIITHFGNSSGGTIGSATVLPIQDGAIRATSIIDALSGKYADLIVTCHGGAIETPEDFEALLKLEPRLDGYVGGSSAERFPIEASVPAATQGFKAVKLSRS
jgi:predicted TIM-barrel enzyme